MVTCGDTEWSEPHVAVNNVVVHLTGQWAVRLGRDVQHKHRLPVHQEPCQDMLFIHT